LVIRKNRLLQKLLQQHNLTAELSLFDAPRFANFDAPGFANFDAPRFPNFDALLLPVQDASLFVAAGFQAIVIFLELFGGPRDHIQNSGSFREFLVGKQLSNLFDGQPFRAGTNPAPAPDISICVKNKWQPEAGLTELLIEGATEFEAVPEVRDYLA
jgi:hypothetical protein